jgi:hypothetical protein
MEMGRIKEFVEKAFDDYRSDRINLKQLVINLCSYADKNISYKRLWGIFEEEVDKQFDELGEIAY